VLDIGTGTGLIALMMAQRCDAEIVAIEPDYSSFQQARENTGNSQWRNRIEVVNSRLQDYYPGERLFDLIVTNPPYFISSLKNIDPALSTARHNDGLTHKDILEGSARLLEPCGELQLILPWDEGNIFIASAPEFGFYCNMIVKIRPTPASELRRLVLSFGRERKKISERFLTIEKGRRHDFTDDYIALTREFYLRF
ncbi:MAG: methyltransferase, partial [Bacteroidales bacterium]|jgi:tRNA1Val (adenine37-N6)-methyltransferase|nr:methyltransferase [Bacteroidales bacterium]